MSGTNFTALPMLAKCPVHYFPLIVLMCCEVQTVKPQIMQFIYVLCWISLIVCSMFDIHDVSAAGCLSVGASNDWITVNNETEWTRKETGRNFLWAAFPAIDCRA
jgi:hypothetical protein